MALEQLLADPPQGDRAASPAGRELRRRVRYSLNRVQAALDAADHAPSDELRDQHLHDVRKAAKRVRYDREVVVPVFGTKAIRFAERMESLQADLGGYQDTLVARGLLREFGVRAHLSGGNAFTFGLLYGLQAGADAGRGEHQALAAAALAGAARHSQDPTPASRTRRPRSSAVASASG